MRWMLLICAVFSAGQATAQTIVDGSGAEIPETLRQAAMQKVADLFKDPMSSQFRRLGRIPSKAPGVEVVCGQVNSKNSYGAYSGFEFFTYIKENNQSVASLTKLSIAEELLKKPGSIHQFKDVGCVP